MIRSSGIDSDRIQGAVKRILEAVGENPDREGLMRTPQRVARMYMELLAGYNTDPSSLVNNALFDVKYDEMVIVRDIEFFSLCEHHLLPFMGRIHVAYIPNGKVIGLFNQGSGSFHFQVIGQQRGNHIGFIIIC